MEQRVSRCEDELRESGKKIGKIEEKIICVNLEKETLSGDIKRIDERMQNIQDQIKQIRDDLANDREVQREDVKSIVTDVKALHECLINIKVDATKNSTIVSVVMPIIVMAIFFFLGIK